MVKKPSSVDVYLPRSDVEFVPTGIRPFAGKKGKKLLSELHQLRSSDALMKRIRELFYRKKST